MAFSAGRVGHHHRHHLIANSSRGLRNLAAAALSSVSSSHSQFFSAVVRAVPEHHHLLRTNSGGQGISCGDNNPENGGFHDESSGSDCRAFSVLPRPWMSGVVVLTDTDGSMSPSSSRSRVLTAVSRVQQFHGPLSGDVSPKSSEPAGAVLHGERSSGSRAVQRPRCSGPPNPWMPAWQYHGSGSRLHTQASWGLGVEELSGIRIWRNPRRGHMGHAHGGGHEKTGKDGERVLGWGLWGDIGLAISKGGAGFVSGSTALIADAAHSVSDIALSGVVLWTSKVAHTPKDKQHPYGHGKFETVGALGISGMLLLTGGGIAWHALETLQPYMPMLSEWVQTATGAPHEHVQGEGHHHGIDLQHPYVALTAAVFSIGVKEMLYRQTKGVGEQEHSELLKASAWHHRSDAVSSIVALIGVGGSMLGLPLLDPVAGFLVAGMIMKAGVETGYQSLQDLVDSGVQESVLSPIRHTVLHVQGVEGCHHLRGRRMGSFIHVDAHIEVDPWLSVSAAHNISEAVRLQLQKEHPEVAETFVHIEPADGGTKTLTADEAELEHGQDDHQTGGSDDHSFSKKDLTKEGSKSDIMKSSFLDEGCPDDSFGNDRRQHPDVEQDVRHVVGANFHEKMSISHVTCHFLQGKVVVEVEVSMNPDISVRNAMDYASDAERAILQRVPDISAVRVQLKLSKNVSQSA